MNASRAKWIALAMTLLAPCVCAQTLTTTPANKVHPRGEIVDRMKLAVAYLDKATVTDIWNGFTETGMWTADWPGRTLEAYSRIWLALGNNISTRYDEIGHGLLERQAEDGAFHSSFGKSDGFNEANDLNKGNGFWFGNSMGLKGLIWAYRTTNDEKYLAAAKRLGEYHIAHYFDTNQPGKPGSFWWIATESLSELARQTGDRKYSEFAQKIAHTITPTDFAGQHTHSYLLALRGAVQVHEALNDPALLNTVLDQYRTFRDCIMWPGGGIVEHLALRKDYVPNYWFDEGCSVDDWLGLNLDLWRVTLDASYMDMVERVHLNHLYYDQDKTGGFCGDRGVDFTREGTPWPFCCAMHGTRTLAELTQYIATASSDGIYLNVFLPASVDLAVKDHPVTIDLDTVYPKNGALKITLKPEAKLVCAVKTRVPAWSYVTKLAVNGEPYPVKLIAGYLTVEREWQPGDTIDITLGMPLRAEPRNRFFGDSASTDYAAVSLWEGPRELVYNQTANNQLWADVGARPALRYVYQTYDQLQKDQSVRKTPLKIGDRAYKKGLGTHAVSELEFALDGQFKEFISDIGVDASTGGTGAVRFKVTVDGVAKAGQKVNASIASGGQGQVAALYGFSVAAMDGKAPADTIKVDVTGARTLRLIVDDGVNGLKDDCADWGDARLVKADGTVVYLSDLPDDTAAGMPWNWGTVTLKKAASAPNGPTPEPVTLEYHVGDKTYPIVFNYLADLGYSLIEARPVLQSYFRVTSKN